MGLRKRTLIELNNDLHKQLKIDAINKGKTLKSVLNLLVKKYLHSESKKSGR